MRRAVPLLLVVALFAAPRPALATSFGTNLIVNGDAESCVPGPSGYEVVAIPGWARVGNLTAVSWGTGGGFPVNTDPGPASRGVAFFSGGPDAALSEISQSIDVSDLAATIDGGAVAFRFAGYLGGYNGQEDNATATLTFRDAVAGSLGGASLGPLTVANRSGLTGLWLRAQEGTVPAGTRSVLVQLVCERLAGSYNDGYADSLSFVLGSSSVGVGDGPRQALELAPVFPNPARDVARFAVRLPAAAEVRLEVLDVRGRRVAVVADAAFEAGAHSLAWRRPEGVGAGVYFARLSSGARVMQRRFVVLD